MDKPSKVEVPVRCETPWCLKPSKPIALTDPAIAASQKPPTSTHLGSFVNTSGYTSRGSRTIK
jgi:hypothetical protein